MTDSVKGKTTGEAIQLLDKFRHLVTDPTTVQLDDSDKFAIFAGVAEYPARVKCAVLSWHTLKSALENKKEKASTENL